MTRSRSLPFDSANLAAAAFAGGIVLITVIGCAQVVGRMLS